MSRVIGGLLVGACSNPFGLKAPDVDFTTDAAAYLVGDTIRLRLVNRTASPLGFNLCFATLERRADALWERVPRQPLDPPVLCPGVLLVLNPGQAATESQPIFDFMEPGVYRFRDKVEWPLNDGRVPIQTAPFEIRAR
ncbi:MAG: hypothetical protein KatS3mg081_1368 [Gemmatimonadales bacterium]|nr:MAG: hypothetical protein KatS3mg081_1368 [Gemmatimonadales bacterium]